jgi:hypothetical protein
MKTRFPKQIAYAHFGYHHRDYPFQEVLQAEEAKIALGKV